LAFSLGSGGVSVPHIACEVELGAPEREPFHEVPVQRSQRGNVQDADAFSVGSGEKFGEDWEERCLSLSGPGGSYDENVSAFEYGVQRRLLYVRWDLDAGFFHGGADRLRKSAESVSRILWGIHFRALVHMRLPWAMTWFYWADSSFSCT